MDEHPQARIAEPRARGLALTREGAACRLLPAQRNAREQNEKESENSGQTNHGALESTSTTRTSITGLDGFAMITETADTP
jgi:hypothetical protein